ncbi:MAG TPA: AMP-binding protein [Sphingopyxis sp.]|nr:AMP-binding protein [Sphingopyxis sp.]HMP45776.1 AMP-binding protein [Sphingopyxis sp.]HMQ17728.1 AMP-binding protein [Sphingopyxis sp.]
MVDYAALPFKPHGCRFEFRSDGSSLITPGYDLPDLWPSIPHLFADRAERFPDRPFVARRELLADGRRGDWRRLRYGDALRQSRALAQAFLDRGIGPDASVMVLSGGSPEHMVVNLAAQMARAPYAPVSVNYALAGGDYARLRHCFAVCRPRLIYADDWRSFLPAMRALREEAALILVTDEAAPGGETIALADLLATPAADAVDASIAAITPDTHAKTIFTSGSTGKPKGVIQTQRILTGVVAQHQAMYEEADHDAHARAFLSWVPWSHVGGNNILPADVLNEAACLYIDDGRPLPGQFAETIRNLGEIHLTEYNSTPIFFSELVGAMEADDGLRDHFFRDLRFLSYGAAGLSQDVFRRLQALAVAATGRGIPIITKYGTTETQGTTIVSRPLESTGAIGLPFAGNVVKLAPVGDRLEIRVKGLTVTPGYLGNDEATAAAFDEKGFYRTGDAARFVDPDRPELGLAFDGRVTENFKLESGTWVHVGALRMALLDRLGLLQDVVIAGEGRGDVRALGWLRPADARRIAGDDLDSAGLAAHPAIVALLAERLTAHNAAAGGQSRRVAALRLLVAPPAGDEIADKGYINQREVQRRRTDEVEALYRGEAILPA